MPIAVVVLATCMAGCTGPRKEYTWTRQEPAIFRESPTTFTVRLSIQPAQRRVLWLQTASDSAGVIDTEIDTLSGCAFFDSKNWEWGGEMVPQRHVSMRNGKLHESYWGEERDYRTVYRIFGRTVAFR